MMDNQGFQVVEKRRNGYKKKGKPNFRNSAKTVKYHKMNSVRIFIQKTHDLTYEKCLEYMAEVNNALDVKAEMIYLLIQFLPSNEDYYSIITAFNRDKEKSHIDLKSSASKEFTYYNAVAWYDTGVSDELIAKIVKLLHKEEYDIFAENKFGENALASVFKKFLDGGITQEEMLFRYSQFINLSPAQVNRLANCYLNKISDPKENNILDVLRLCMMINPNNTVKMFIVSLVDRRPPRLEYDNFCNIFVTTFLNAIKDIDFNYANTEHRSDLALAFKQLTTSNTEKMLIQTFIDYNQECFDTSPDCCALVIGELANKGYNEHFDLLFCRLLNEQDIELAVRLIMRMFIQKCSINKDQIKSLAKLYFKDGLPRKEQILIMNYLEEVLKTRINVLNLKNLAGGKDIEVKEEIKQETANYPLILDLFGGLIINDIDTVLDDTMYELECIIKKDNRKEEIALQTVYNLLSKFITHKTEIPGVVTSLRGLFTKQELLDACTIVEADYALDLGPKSMALIQIIEDTLN